MIQVDQTNSEGEHTARVVSEYTQHALFVVENDRQLSVGEEKVDVRCIRPPNILGQGHQFVWVLLESKFTLCAARNVEYVYLEGNKPDALDRISNQQ